MRKLHIHMLRLFFVVIMVIFTSLWVLKFKKEGQPTQVTSTAVDAAQKSEKNSTTHF